MKITLNKPTSVALLLLVLATVAGWIGYEWSGSSPAPRSGLESDGQYQLATSAGRGQTMVSPRDHSAGVSASKRVFAPLNWGKSTAPEVAGNLEERRIMATAWLSPKDMRPLAELKIGDQLALPLGEGDTVTAVVRNVFKDDVGWRRVAGVFTEGLGGQFSLSQRIEAPGEWAGTILRPDRKTAYQVKTENGNVLVHRKPIDAVICASGMPKAPGEPPRGALAAAGLPSVLAEAPPSLQSNPTASGVLYLDFDGETVTDPDWNGGATIVAAPAVVNGVAITNTQITDVWTRVAEDFRPFDVNVTTDRSVYDSAPISARALCVVTPTDTWYSSSVGGVAFLRSYRGPAEGFASKVPCWVFNNSSTSVIALTCSHELGHMVGLRHDGTPSLTYYGGHDTGATSWGPIMGAPWGRAVTQWSIGDYVGANNQEDDFLIVSNIIQDGGSATGYVADEAGATTGTAKALAIVGTVSQPGIISSSTDVDYFMFKTAGGTANITASPAAVDGNLDIELTLMDNTGTVLSTSPILANSLAGNVTRSLTAGTYYLGVRGKGRAANPTASPPISGYSNYGSVGYYNLTGTYAPLPVIPLITEEPAVSTTAVQGTKVTLTVKAISNTGMTYQWRKNGFNMTGKTSSSLVFTSVQPSDAATYSVVVKNAAGDATSGDAVLDVHFKPVFTLQPLPAKSTVATGSDVTYTVANTGTATITYQWRKNGVDIGGETNASLTLTSVDFFDSGTYTVVASNGIGSTTSASAVLTVTSGPIFTIQPPLIKPVALGGSASVVVKSVGSPTIRYQWFKDTVLMPGKTSATLAFSKTTLAAEGTYFVRATNGQGFTDSDSMVVDVQDKPVITLHPQASTTLNADDSLTLTCAASGTETLLYQWQQNSVNIPGANSASLTLNPVSWLHRGTYRCVVSNAVGSATTKNAVVTVVSYPVIITPPASIKIPKNGTGVLKVVAGGTPTLKYQWTKDGVDIPKATGTSLTLSKASHTTTPANYAVRVTNLQAPAGVTSVAAAVTVEDPPVITTQPVALIAGIGGSATFSVVATGSPILRYQWQRNNVNIGGATNDTLTLNSLVSTDSATFRVIVTNDVGKATSASVKLSVQTSPTISKQPISQVWYEHDTATFSVTAAGSATLKYQWRKDDVNIPNATSASLKLVNMTASQAGTYTVVVSNAVGSITSDPATLQIDPVPTPTFVAFSPTQGPVGSKFYIDGTNLKWTTQVTINGKVAAFVVTRTTELLVTVPTGATSGPVVVKTHGGQVSGPGSYTVTSYGTITNDNRIDATILSGPVNTTVTGTSDNKNATRESPEFSRAGKTVWFHWRANASGTFAFTTASSPFDTYLYLYSGPGVPVSYTGLTFIGSNDDGFSYFGPSRVDHSVTSGTDYYMCVDSYSNTPPFNGVASGRVQMNIYRVYSSEREPNSVAVASFEPVDGFKAGAPLAGQKEWLVQGQAAGIESNTPVSAEGASAYVGGAGDGATATIAWLGAGEIAPGSVVNASVDLSIDSKLGTPELFSWTVFDTQAAPVFSLSFDGASGAILSQVAGAEASPTGQIFVPGEKYNLELQIDYATGTWGVTLNGAWILEQQPLPASAVENGFGDVGAVWVPAPGSTSGGKMHFDNLSIESRPSAQ